MQIRVVTLRYNEALQEFPEDVLKVATFGREVLNVSEHVTFSSGSNRVKRGGSWNNNADNCTSSNRNNNTPSNENNNNGFRLVSTVSEQTGFHSGTPALRGRGDKHARLTSVSSSIAAAGEALISTKHKENEE
jgi:hypothetical protein